MFEFLILACLRKPSEDTFAAEKKSHETMSANEERSGAREKEGSLEKTMEPDDVEKGMDFLRTCLGLGVPPTQVKMIRLQLAFAPPYFF